MKKKTHMNENMTVTAMKRRDFMKSVAGGITILFTVSPASLLSQRRGEEYPSDFNAYLRIHENGRVSCFTGKIEMGQGIITSLAQMLAEELEVPLQVVDMVMGDTALCPYDNATVGSRSTKYFGPPLRNAAAEARRVLLELAAERLGTPSQELMISNGVIFLKNDPQKQLTYAELAEGQRIEKHLSEPVAVKHFSEHKISGKATLRTDSLVKVTGEAKFTSDVQLPGMLYAKILRPPSHDAKLVSVDTSRAETIPGILTIHEDDLVAVLHEHPDIAETALEQINAKFIVPDTAVDNETIFDHLIKSVTSQEVVVEKGDPLQVKKAAKSIAMTFYNHYVSHAPIETHSAVVQVDPDQVTVWASTQSPFRVRDSVAQVLGISSDKVRVITPFVGGGFGGKTWSLQVTEAAKLANLVGKPVQVAWTRQEEFFYDSFRPAAVIKANGGHDDRGRILFWEFDIFFTGTRSCEPVYDIPHQRITSNSAGRSRVHPFNVGAWRGPGSNTNVFAMESQIDLLAKSAGLDALSFRLLNLKDDRMKRVLETAANRFGHSFSKLPSGQGYGVACTNYLGTYLAIMAEVDVDEQTGRVRVKRLVCAQDMGEIINPHGAKIQIEGCLTMGVSAALNEEIQFHGGKVLTQNFGTYELTRFSHLPKIETILIDQPEMPPQGCGEPAITAMGAVLANAIHDAVGIRCDTLPMTPGRIKTLLSHKR